MDKIVLASGSTTIQIPVNLFEPSFQWNHPHPGGVQQFNTSQQIIGHVPKRPKAKTPSSQRDIIHIALLSKNCIWFMRVPKNDEFSLSSWFLRFRKNLSWEGLWRSHFATIARTQFYNNWSRMHARTFIHAYIHCSCDIGQIRKQKGYPDEKLRK